MSRFELRPGLRKLFRLPLRSAPGIHADADEELEALIAARIEFLLGRGMWPDAARAEALRRLGASLDTVRSDLHLSAEQRERRMRLRDHIETLVQDLRYAVRGLARRPGFTAVAVLTLAIGIGATTAIFSAVNALLLRPLPYAKPDELMKVTLVTPPRGDRPGTDQMVWSYPKFVVFRDAQRVFSNLALYTADQFAVTSGDVERLSGEEVGASYFRTLGIAPARGRDFDPTIDAQFDVPKQVILSYAFWQRRFSGDAGVIGRAIDFSRAPYAIVGVAPPGFRGLTGNADVFVPITTNPATDFQPQMHSFSLVARLAPRVTPAQAASAVATLGARVSDAYPNPRDKAKWGAKSEPLNNDRVSPLIKRSLLVLFAAVALVLLIACVNVANLLVARASARRREIAVRLALGAGRARLMRLLLTESVVLALLGGAASVAVAWIGVRAIGRINPETTLRAPRDGTLGAAIFSSISLDGTALAFTFGVTIVVGLSFGVLPALGATRASLSDAIKDNRVNDRATFGGRAIGARQLLVVSEVALALVLLAGSGLMIRSLGRLLSTDEGFDGHNVLTLQFNVPRDGRAADSLPVFYQQLIERMRAIPGVTDAALNNCAPLSGGCAGTGMRPLDHPEIDMTHAPSVGIHWASPSWFSLMGVPLKRGRVFTNADRAGGPQVILINEAAARHIWPNEDPIGRRVEVGMSGAHDVEVIGIVGDVRQKADSAATPQVYLNLLQFPGPSPIVFVRGARNASSLVPDARRVIHELAPLSPVYDLKTMDERTSGATARARFSATLLGLFALTALSLAAIGIYGVMSLAVTARTREIGIRIALGADRRRVQRLVVGEGLALVVVGAVVGIGGALLATRALQSLLFDTQSSDPATYAVIVLLMGGAAVLASWLPARRASRVDPITALRAE